MIWSGLTILAFVVYHLLHYTVRVGNSYNTDAYKIDLHGEKVHNVYKMVIDGFSWAPASIFYLIAMALLCSHLSHGFSSLFQTLGISTDKSEPLFKKAGYAFAGLIFAGNAAIVLSIWLFGYGR
jgi:succinate dehydrogenase / fumarate reductase cytochrome b subunit